MLKSLALHAQNYACIHLAPVVRVHHPQMGNRVLAQPALEPEALWYLQSLLPVERRDVRLVVGKAEPHHAETEQVEALLPYLLVDKQHPPLVVGRPVYPELSVECPHAVNPSDCCNPFTYCQDISGFFLQPRRL